MTNHREELLKLVSSCLALLKEIQEIEKKLAAANEALLETSLSEHRAEADKERKEELEQQLTRALAATVRLAAGRGESGGGC